MAEAAGAAEAAPLLRGIPDEIVVWEVLVRLPPKALLRCRAICPAWRRASSSRRFLLAHHRRQPTLPLLCGHNSLADDDDDRSVDIILLDNRRGLPAADQLRSAARLGPVYWFFRVEASCDGLLVLTINCNSLCICNPATRQYAPLPLIYGISLVGMYLHPTAGEYRLLLHTPHPLRVDLEDGYYVFTLGSGQPPRHIGCPDAKGHIEGTGSVPLHGSLHWCMPQMIVVFNTTTESFRRMCSPIVSGRGDLFEMDGMLAVCRFDDVAMEVHIWVLEDYKSEVWDLKHRVALPVAQLKVRFGEFKGRWNVVLPSWDGDVLLLLLRFGDDWLLQLDTNGNLVASFHSKALGPTQHQLKPTLVPHTFFPTLEGYSVNALPFI